ncbi:oxygen-independent coproporphyrinogen III oxidase [Echinicola strongylocentroti]|uniref:Coproporphyrinogen-III oxidase n=1 Tax=Echinicola strongylocentroti TaxID=1795355 RepID=A0A2Z4IEM6_9BACT|nr:oxygen-independent coproporphyrinogen III oxidase [Echinicola strongylocentroti]AWW29315.1 oxygen-independent coproporphyrinogen III oxidase [Echinicola strongylocentroti]
MEIPAELIDKYDVAVPRYTSYPTVPLWENDLDEHSWKNNVQKAYREFGDSEGISLYIHLPYCDSLCTYCGCNKHITKNHDKEIPYLEALRREWDMYLEMLPSRPKLAAIHLGGGTPTFFSAENLQSLIQYILDSSSVLSQAKFSFEGHPNNTTLEHLLALKEVGFTRVSYGVQDLDHKVQKAIHRIQPISKVEEATYHAQLAGFQQINYDLIYGLPHQTEETILNTMEEIRRLMPSRIAFYSYAHVPSVFQAQKSFEQYLPKKAEKRNLYETGKAKLTSIGYEEIGMDHFALPGDELLEAKQTGRLHRNFMGYTDFSSHILIGLGSSAISDVHYAYAQNTKDIELYKEQVNLRHFSHSKGHNMTLEDIKTRKTIMDLICTGTTDETNVVWRRENMKLLNDLQEDGLITMRNNEITVTPLGTAFIRNICSAFDHRMKNKQSQTFVFSKAI